MFKEKMASQISSNKRIVKNTFLLYVRSIFTMAVGLYTSRVFLQVLGVENVGIYNVVGGLVSLFSMISSTMKESSSRFLAIALGRGNKKDIHQVFSISLSMNIIFAIVVIFIAEIIGTWYINTYMNIAPDRLFAANIVFQVSLITFGFSMVGSAYNNVIRVHEHMSTFAYIGIIEVICKLLILYILIIINYDRLIVYAILMCLISILNRFICSLYCFRHFEETRNVKLIFNISVIREQLHFAGWNSIGVISGFLRSYGVDILLNFYFGVTVNAAKGIAGQVQNAIFSFVTNFQSAINPQITKSYGAGDINRVHQLVISGSKFSFFLLSLFALPIFIEADNLLKIWLHIVPEYTVSFLRIALIILLLECIANLVISSLLAEGSIKKQQIIIGPITIMTIPLMAVFFSYTNEPIYGYFVMLLVDFSAWLVRLYFWKRLLYGKISSLLFNVLIRCFLSIVVASILPAMLVKYFSGGIIELFSITIICVICDVVCFLLIGLNGDERIFVLSKIKSFIKNKIKMSL